MPHTRQCNVPALAIRCYRRGPVLVTFRVVGITLPVLAVITVRRPIFPRKWW